MLFISRISDPCKWSEEKEALLHILRRWDRNVQTRRCKIRSGPELPVRCNVLQRSNDYKLVKCSHLGSLRLLRQ